MLAEHCTAFTCDELVCNLHYKTHCSDTSSTNITKQTIYLALKECVHKCGANIHIANKHLGS